jgi:hypothetical protein
MKLYEIFQQTLPIEITTDTATEFSGSFHDPDGNLYYFGLEEIPKLQKNQPNLWHAEFSTDTGKKKTTLLLGDRKAFVILSTVVNVVLNQIDKRNIDNMYITARNSEPSRVSLYRVISQRIAKKKNWFVREEPGVGNSTMFTLSSKKLRRGFIGDRF